MKRCLLKSLAVVAFAMIAGYNVYQSDSVCRITMDTLSLF